MQVLIFMLGDDRYGLDTRSIVRVLPLMALKRIPQAPAFVAGLMNLHGVAVPVIDLLRLSCDIDFQPCYDTRIVLVNYPAAEGDHALLGLIASHVIGIEKIDNEEFSAAGVLSAEAPYLGKVATTGAGILQLVDLDQLLSKEVRAILYQPTESSASC